MLDCKAVGVAFSKAKVLLKDIKEDLSYLEDTKLAFINFYLELKNKGKYDEDLFEQLSKLFEVWVYDYEGNKPIEDVCKEFNSLGSNSSSSR
ncbi:hypothetical protein GWK48_07945 [Metallosphaera tengchongensis]|uniref:Uncharacterized protein n=1 Tax=Metallosphaera tengchongensis TaxID=1532350 RepID=A0A6N0NVS2_9CREN|nr:hypothetical protein [Metallosphaera tengchongensis]QKR00315.1 hypothetical protein GWK48_07945 [Metallosphaera tengchongensis]